MIDRLNLYTHPMSMHTSNVMQNSNQVDKQSFQNVLKNALENISKQEHEADFKREMLSIGKIDDLHDVMITAQKAKITVETAVQIQQKVIDTYNEIMRMQI